MREAFHWKIIVKVSLQCFMGCNLKKWIHLAACIYIFIYIFIYPLAQLCLMPHGYPFIELIIHRFTDLSVCRYNIY